MEKRSGDVIKYSHKLDLKNPDLWPNHQNEHIHKNQILQNHVIYAVVLEGSFTKKHFWENLIFFDSNDLWYS